MRIAYFAHDVADAAVQKRLQMLHIGGASVVLLGFLRRPASARESSSTDASVFVLGRTANGKLAQRILSVFAALARGWSARKHWADADVIVARNLEMLVVATMLAPLVGSHARIVYEALDIHRLMLRNDFVGSLMRSGERKCEGHFGREQCAFRLWRFCRSRRS